MNSKATVRAITKINLSIKTYNAGQERRCYIIFKLLDIVQYQIGNHDRRTGNSEPADQGENRTNAIH